MAIAAFPNVIDLGGQKVTVNQLSGVLVLKISNPFYSAGKIKGWVETYGSPAFGINAEIVKFVGQFKLKLLIRCDTTPQKEYWITPDALLDFILRNDCQYLTSGTPLFLIPWRIFKPKPLFH